MATMPDQVMMEEFDRRWKEAEQITGCPTEFKTLVFMAALDVEESRRNLDEDIRCTRGLAELI